jgi:truncated hemoglobin YjbI/ankyrin repeat protein
MQTSFELVRSLPFPVQTGLKHRGVFGSGDAPLFPPDGTFEALGGREAVARLVDGLYDRIEKDAVLRPAFHHDLTEHRQKVKLYFEAWFGGDQAYFNAEWRHGLGPTHWGISISSGMIGRWIGHFLDSLAEVVQGSNPGLVNRIEPYILRLARALVNRSNEPVPGERLLGSYSGESEVRPFMTHVQRDDAAGIAALAAETPRMIARRGPLFLLISVVRGKAKAAEEFLRQGVDVNIPALLPGSEANAAELPPLRMTPLCGALLKHRESIVRLLARHGAQYDIFTASCVGDVDAVRELLNLDPQLADVHDPACDVAPITPLLHAVFAGQLEVANLLLQRGATVGVNGVRLVRAAANAGQDALVDLLLEHAADPTRIGPGKWVMYPDIANKLLARGADVNLDVNLEPGKWIGMCCTGNSGHKEDAALARAMLRCGADVAARYKGRTALHCAAKAGFVHVAEALIEHGADVNALNDLGQTPLDEVENAAKSIDREPVRRLLVAHHARRSGHRAHRHATGRR